MTGPMGEQGEIAQKLVEEAKQMWTAAAVQSDSADGLGIDGRIGLVHGLVDVSVKSWAAWVEAFIKGGGAFFPGSGSPNTPLPSEIIKVAPATYPRTIEVDGVFTRIGLPKVTIPASAVAFDPPFLPAGLTEFRILLKDYRFIGSNFTGKIKLAAASTGTTLAPQGLVSDEKEVTVGL